MSDPTPIEEARLAGKAILVDPRHAYDPHAWRPNRNGRLELTEIGRCRCGRTEDHPWHALDNEDT